MKLVDDYGNPYAFSQLPPFTTPEFTRLSAAVADRAPTLRLHTRRLDTGQLVITVLVPPENGGEWEVGCYIARSFNDQWQLHHPTDGPQMEFRTAQQIAKFLSVVPRFEPGWNERWDQWMQARGELFASE